MINDILMVLICQTKGLKSRRLMSNGDELRFNTFEPILGEGSEVEEVNFAIGTVERSQIALRGPIGGVRVFKPMAGEFSKV